MYKFQILKIEAMQLNKGAHYQDNSLFPEHLLIQDLPFTHNSYNQRKTGTFPRNREEQSHPHLDQQNGGPALGSSQLRFYQQYKKIYTVSFHLALEKARQAAIIDCLAKRVKNLEEKAKDAKEKDTLKNEVFSQENKAKRSRRTAQEIEKKFKCQVEYCQRLYGSEGSLQQHIKLKHPQLYQKSHNEDSNASNNDSFP